MTLDLGSGPGTARAAIEAQLGTYKHVLWDRYTVAGNVYLFYGWIDREKDSYKDFVVLEVSVSRRWIRYKVLLTSCTDHDKVGLRGETIKCKRVEDAFHVPNCICMNTKITGE